MGDQNIIQIQLNDFQNHYTWLNLQKDFFDENQQKQNYENFMIIREQLEGIIAILNNSNTDQSSQLQRNDIEQYYDKFLQSLIEKLILTGKYYDLEVFKVVDDIIDKVVIIMALELKNKNKMLKLSEIYRNIFDLSQKYYMENNLEDGGFETDTGDQQPAAINKSMYAKSKSIRRYANDFQQYGGYQALIDNIQDRNIYFPLDQVCNYMFGMGHKNIDRIFSYYFLNEYLPDLKKSLYEYIVESPDQNVRLITGERIDIIKDALVNLLDRVEIFSITTSDKNKEFMEHFCLETSLICLNAESLPLNVNGVKWLSELVEGHWKRSVTAEYLVKWIEKHEIFDKIFDKANSHEQLLQRSDKILRFMLKEKMIKNHHIESIFSLLQKNQETFICMCKIIDQVSYDLTVEHVEMLINLMLQNEDNLTKNHVELIFNIQYWINSQNKDDKEDIKKIKEKVYRFYTNLIYNTKVSKDILDETLKYTSKMIKWDKTDNTQQKEELINECISNIKENVSVGNSIKFLKELIDTYPSNKYGSSNYQVYQSDVIVKIIEEQNVVEAIIENIGHVKNSFRQVILNQNNGQQELQQEQQNLKKNNYDLNKKLYLEKLWERISFIMYLTTEMKDKQDLIINFQFLCQIWDLMIFQSLVVEERDLIFKWLKKLNKEKCIDDFTKFFKEKMFENHDFIENISIEGFECFKNIFISINIQQQKIQKLQKLTYNMQGIRLINCDNYNKNNNIDKEKDQNESDLFPYQLLVVPEQIEGYEILKKIIHQVQDYQVFEKSSTFYIQLCINLSSKIDDHAIQVRQQIINDKLDELKQVQQNLKNDQLSSQQKQELHTQLQKVIDFLMCLFGESEQKGFEGLKSHSQLIKGEIIQLKIKNNMNQTRLQNNILKIRSNCTVIDLIIEISKMIETSWDKIKIKVNKQPISTKNIGRTLSDLKLKDNDFIAVVKREAQEKFVPYADLLDSEGLLLSKAKIIFISWFKRFSENGQMSRKTCADFLNSCFNTSTYTSENILVTQTFSNYDKEKKGYLVEDDFLMLYQTAAPKNSDLDSMKQENAVFKNLRSFGYRTDLKKESDVELEKVDINTLPRYILTQNQEFYQILFEILKQLQNSEHKISEKIMDLLNYMPTFKQIFEKITNIEQLKQDWDQIFDTNDSNFQLLYNLIVIQYLIESEQQQQYSSQQVHEENKNNFTDYLFKKDEKWGTIFIQQGGFSQLQKVFEKYSKNDQKQLSTLEKNILGFIMNIMKTYITAILRQKTFFIYQISDYTRFNAYNIEIVEEYLNLDEQELADMNNNQLQEAMEIEQQENKDEQPQISSSNNNNKKLKRMYEYKCGKCDGELKFTKDPYQDQDYGYCCDICCNSYDNGQSSYHCGCSGDKEDMYDVCLTCYNYTGPDQSQEDQEKEKQEQEKNTGKKNQKPARILESKEFQIVASRLEGELGQTIIKDLNIERFSINIINILRRLLQNSLEKQQEDRQIIELGISIMISILLSSEEILQQFIEQEQQMEFILDGLFNQNEWVRGLFSKFLYMLMRYKNSLFGKYILKHLLENIPSSKNDSKKECNEFYEILCRGIENIKDIKLDLQKLQTTVFDNIESHQSTEDAHDSNSNDKILLGHLQFAESLLRNCEIKDDKSQYQLIFNLFESCLFMNNVEQVLDNNNSTNLFENGNGQILYPQNYVKCRQKKSRNLVYKMIIDILLQNKQQYLSEFFKNSIIPLVNNIHKVDEWNFKPERFQKSYTGKVGIYNIQNICYMNSMIQQLYNTDCFRYGILAALDNQEKNPILNYQNDMRKYCTNKSFDDDNVLHQFQQLFAFLQLSERKFYHPLEFCFSMKGYDGEPCDVVIQQDTQEFMNMFFDKIEHCLKETPWKDLVINVYGGKMASQLICQGCGNVNERDEQFYNWSLTVQNKTGLHESLQGMIEGEVISDYLCQECNNRCDQQKRVLMNQLPNFLVLHLQRIVFDMDTFLNKKISDKFEFPQLLNVEPYTKEGVLAREQVQQQQGGNIQLGRKNSEFDQQQQPGLVRKESANEVPRTEGFQQYKEHPKSHYEYRLKGVVVHSGTAEYGHYYSYINTDGEKWLEFNDAITREFDSKDLQKECFGGSTNNEGFYDRSIGDSSSNAYMLVYEKIQKQDLKFKINQQQDLDLLKQQLNLEVVGEEQIEKVQNSINNKEDQIIDEQEEEKPLYLNVDPQGIKDIVNQNLQKKVWLDNHKFMVEKQVYSESFFKFIKELCNCVDIPQDFDNKLILDNTKPDYYKNYQKLSQETKEANQIILQDFLPTYLFQVLAKANDNKILNEMLPILKKLIALQPHLSYQFFKKHFFDNKQYVVIEVMLKCIDVGVRQFYSHFLTFLINIIIKYYKLDLNLQNKENKTDEQRQIERNLNEFFDYMVSLLNTDVAKNWMRFEQYLYFWLNFIDSGKIQQQWALQNEFISRMIDFMLSKQSPLNENIYGRKIHEMGVKNEYNDAYSTKPGFKPVFQMLNKLISQSNMDQCVVQGQQSSNNGDQQQQDYQLSENDIICLKSKLFYEKSMMDSGGEISILQNIIVKLCYNDYQYSKDIAGMLLERIEFSEESNAYWVEIYDSFLGIEDEYQDQRIEWIFGVLHLKCEENKFALKAFYKKMTAAHASFYTPLHRNISYLDIIFRDTYSQSVTYQSDYRMVQIQAILTQMDKNEKVFKFIASQPSICYIGGDQYLDWMELFIGNYKYESKSNKLKTEIAERCENLLKKIRQKQNEYIEQGKIKVQKMYITGQTINQQIIEQQEIADKVNLIQDEFELYLVENKSDIKNQKTLVFPQEAMDTDNSVDHRKIPEDSDIWNFVYVPEQYQNMYKNNIADQNDEIKVQGEIIKNNYVRRIYVENNSDHDIQVHFYFKQIEGQNFDAPRHQVQKNIASEKREILFIIHKKDINLDFGEVGIYYKIVSKNSNNNINTTGTINRKKQICEPPVDANKLNNSNIISDQEDQEKENYNSDIEQDHSFLDNQPYVQTGGHIDNENQNNQGSQATDPEYKQKYKRRGLPYPQENNNNTDIPNNNQNNQNGNTDEYRAIQLQDAQNWPIDDGCQGDDEDENMQQEQHQSDNNTHKSQLVGPDEGQYGPLTYEDTVLNSDNQQQQQQSQDIDLTFNCFSCGKANKITNYSCDFCMTSF